LIVVGILIYHYHRYRTWLRKRSEIQAAFFQFESGSSKEVLPTSSNWTGTFFERDCNVVSKCHITFLSEGTFFGTGTNKEGDFSILGKFSSRHLKWLEIHDPSVQVSVEETASLLPIIEEVRTKGLSKRFLITTCSGFLITTSPGCWAIQGRYEASTGLKGDLSMELSNASALEGDPKLATEMPPPTSGIQVLAIPEEPDATVAPPAPGVRYPTHPDLRRGCYRAVL